MGAHNQVLMFAGSMAIMYLLEAAQALTTEVLHQLQGTGSFVEWVLPDSCHVCFYKVLTVF